MGVGGNHTRHSRYKDQAMCDRDRAPSSTLSLSHRVQQIAGLYADLPPGVSLRPLSVRLQHDPALGRLALQVPPPTVYMPRRQQTFSPQQARLCAKDPAHSEHAQTVHKKKTGLFRDLSLRHKFKKAAGVHRRLPSGITFSSPSVRLQHDPTLDRRVSQLRSTISTTQLPSQEVCPDLLSLPADEQQQTPKSKRGPPDFTASHHTAKENHSGDSAALPPAFIDTVAPALVRDMQDSRPAAQPLPWERAPATESAEDPGEGTSSGTSSVPVWQGASKASSSTAHPRVPSLASRRGKQQAPSSQAAPQEPCSSSHSQTTHTSAAAKGDGGQEAGEPTGVAFPRNPPTIQRGSLVWMKFQHHPYWPAVVKSMCKTEKTARVLLIEACMPTERRGIQVPLRKLKHLDCREKETLVKRASKQYQHAVKWCLALVAQYTEARAHRSFRGSFLTFYSTDATSSTRKAIKDCDGPISFPEVNYADLEDWEEEDRWLGGMSRCKKILPDRMKAAWNRENQKLVDFIVKRKGADPHLLDIVHGRKYSQWLASFLKSARYMICVETYLEDEDQLEAVVKHLQTVYKEMGQRMKRAIRNDPVSFVLEVLLPEAIICAISALYGLEYNDAETKYLEGPPVHTREKELFDRKILKQVRKKAARASIAN
ncbi:PWWP domain-containing DNA repair factor 4 [Sorex araneus]|uniref:PWWP domain-containing DNA repair factor 4 n=1 Tax=Sorex araneus TaxID=42254 RepID=UPI00243356C4|nr:PWWP domain-containing DNA repair factor 4 [Sorex araneus]